PAPASRATTPAVSSVLPSSTRTISCGVLPSAAAISGRSSARFSASFRAGTTTVTSGASVGAIVRSAGRSGSGVQRDVGHRHASDVEAADRLFPGHGDPRLRRLAQEDRLALFVDQRYTAA